MTAVVLHLSDIHIHSNRDWIMDKAESIASCLYAVLHEASTVFVVISGDIAQYGKAEEYEAAKTFLDKLRAAISAERNVPIHFVISPGNHDCDFALNNKTRLLTLSSIRTAPKK